MTEGEQKDEGVRAEEKYKALVETAADAIITLDLLGRLTFVNPAAERISGYSEEELVGKHFRELLPANYIPGCLNAFQKALRGQPTAPIEVEMMTKQGERVPLELLGTPVKRGRRVVEIVGIARDIAERKRAEEEIRRRSEETATLNAIAMTVTSTLDLQEVVQSIQERVMKLFGEKYAPIFSLFNEGDQTFKVMLTPLQEKVVRRAEKLIGMRVEGFSFALSTVKPALRDALFAGKPYMTDDGSDLPLHGVSPRMIRVTQRTLGVKWIVDFPLWVKEKLVGTMLLFSQKEKIADEEIELLSAIANQIGVAIENATLYEAAQQELAERKRAEEALRESETRFRTMVETAPSLLLVCDADGNNIYVSPNCEEIAGYTQQELQGRVVFWVHEDDMPRVKEVYDRTFRKGVGYKDVEYKAVKKNGELWYASSSWEPIKDPEGKLQGVVFQTVDITERKRVEEALRESEEKYRDLIERANDGIVIVQETMIRYANPRLAEMWGGTVQEVIGTPFTDHVHPDDLPKVVDRYKRRMAGKDVTPIYETVLRRKDGSKLYAELNAGIITYQGKSADLVIVRDITERKQAEEEIRRRSEELATLYDVSLDVAAQLDLDTLLKTILLRAMELLRANAGGLYLYHPERQDLELIVHQALHKDYRGIRLALGEGACGKVAQSGEPLVVTDYSNWEGRSPHFADEPTFNVLAVPIKRGDILLGALYVDDPDVERRFDDGDIRLATLLANQAAIAIENAQLFQEGQRRAEEMAALRQVNLATLSTLEREQVFEIMLDQLGTVIDYDTAAIKIITPDGRDKMIAGRGPVIHDQAMWDGFDMKDNKLVHEMKETRQTVVVPDTHTDERYERVGNWEAFHSWVGAPLFVKDDLIGYLAVEKTPPGFYDENAVQLLGDFARAAAIALENAKLYEETQKRLAETTVLHRVAEVINATLDLKEVFQRVVEELSTTFGYRLVDIYLLEEEGLRLQANIGYDDKVTIELIPLERGVIGRVARTGQPALIPDVSQDPDYILDDPETTNEICVPIASGQAILGVLNVESDDRRPLTDDDLQLLSTLSSHIGVAIENARLYEEEQRRSAQRRTITEVGRRAASILEMDALLPQVVDLIAQNFGYYHVHIFQIDPDSDYAVHKAGTGKAGLAIAEGGLRLKVGKEGIIGWVAGHGHPLLVNDVGQEPRYYPHPALPDTRSELAVPIRVGGRIIGVLDVQSTELDAFDEGDLETLQTLADQLAVAMENARHYQETKRLAMTDGLTGLYNLRYFYEALEKEIQRSERYHRSVSLIILDIDNFKRYNDTYGHLAGDDLLQKLAQLMSKVTRRTDTLARYGGEEFAIILPETETAGARFLAERLQEGVREHRFSIQDGRTIGRITISLGVATYPHHADSAKALVDTADKALLRAKQAGKNRLSVYGEELIELKPR